MVLQLIGTANYEFGIIVFSSLSTGVGGSVLELITMVIDLSVTFHTV